MNMKKVLAVVMAVMLAISAMAVTAFAADYEITLSAAGSSSNGSAYSTVEFTIPVWAQYGYAVAGDKITLTLPTSIAVPYGYEEVDGEYVGKYYNAVASYVVVANGVSYALGLNNDATTVVSNSTATWDMDGDGSSWGENDLKITHDVTMGNYDIVFGTLAHGYNTNDKNAVIPQSTVVGDNASLTVIATWSIDKDVYGNETLRVSAADFKYYTDPSQNGYTNSKFTTTFWSTTQHYDVKAISNDNPNSVSYCWDWNPVDGADIAANDSTWTAGLTNLKWDATLTNKAMVIGAETAKVVVKLNKTLVGNYYFGLNAVYTDGTSYDLSSNYLNVGKETKAYAAYVEIEEPTDTIVFEIPKAVLYSTNYGVFNEYITIECLDVFHQTIIDTIKAQVKSGILNGTLGDYSWTASWSGATPSISFCGQELNSYWNQFVGTTNCAGGAVTPASVTIVLSTTDVEDTAEDIVVEDPVESTEEESEEITVTEPVVEDTNPGTGIALAVVPMVLAAAAVVASKRR